MKMSCEDARTVIGLQRLETMDKKDNTDFLIVPLPLLRQLFSDDYKKGIDDILFYGL